MDSKIFHTENGATIYNNCDGTVSSDSQGEILTTASTTTASTLQNFNEVRYIVSDFVSLGICWILSSSHRKNLRFKYKTVACL